MIFMYYFKLFYVYMLLYVYILHVFPSLGVEENKFKKKIGLLVYWFIPAQDSKSSNEPLV